MWCLYLLFTVCAVVARKGQRTQEKFVSGFGHPNNSIASPSHSENTHRLCSPAGKEGSSLGKFRLQLSSPVALSHTLQNSAQAMRRARGE